MRSLDDYIVKPLGKRYNNVKKVGEAELIVNTEIQNHQYINKEAVVIETPVNESLGIKKGDIVLVNHNVFRRWYNVRGIEKNSRSYFKEDKYFVKKDQLYLYKREDEWKAVEGYSFVQPIKNKDVLSTEKEQPFTGIVEYSNKFDKKDLIGFMPGSEYEFIVGKKRLYRVIDQFITIKYEYQGNEEEYNPSWA